MQARKTDWFQVTLRTHTKPKRGKAARPRTDPVWEMEYRLRNGRESEKILGKAWLKASRPPAGFLTEGQAQMAAQQFMDAHAESVPDDRKTFGRACAEFIRDCEREKNLSGGTIYEYQRIANRLCERLWRREETWAVRPLDSFTAEDLIAVREELLDQGKNAHTINQTRGVVRGVFGERPVVRGWKWASVKKRDSKGKIQAYTPQQLSQLRMHAADARDLAIYTLAGEQGFRLNEIRGLKLINVRFDLKPPSLQIEDGYTKHGGHAGTKGRKVRALPMTQNCQDVLRPICEGRPHYDKDGAPTLVFEEAPGVPLDYDRLRRRLDKAIKAAGIPRLTLHKLRHTFATITIQSPKVNIYKLQRMLGHEQITTTEGYLHYDGDPELAETLTGLFEPDEPPTNVVPIRRAS